MQPYSHDLRAVETPNRTGELVVEFQDNFFLLVIHAGFEAVKTRQELLFFVSTLLSPICGLIGDTNKQGWVVSKSMNTNPGLKGKLGISFS